MEWRKHIGTEAEWRKLENGSEDIIKVRKAKGSVGRRKRSQNGKEKKQRLNW